MTNCSQVDGTVGRTDLLERAITYTLGSLWLVSPERLAAPTPCRQWDLRALLVHVGDSVRALREAMDERHVDLAETETKHQVTDSSDDAGMALVTGVRDQVRQLLGAWIDADTDAAVSIGGCALSTDLVTGAGAIEVAVHGWDVAHACGYPRPLPERLAAELLPLATVVVVEADRPARFAAPVEAAACARPSTRLLGFLGRDPSAA